MAFLNIRYTHLMFTSSRDPGRTKRSVMRQKAANCDGPSMPDGSEKSPLSYLPSFGVAVATYAKGGRGFVLVSIALLSLCCGESKIGSARAS